MLITMVISNLEIKVKLHVIGLVRHKFFWKGNLYRNVATLFLMRFQIVWKNAYISVEYLLDVSVQ